jgi:hypothetical protein
MIDRRTLHGCQRFLAAVAILISPCGALSASAESGSPYGERWVYCSANLQVDKSTNDVIELIQRASRDGYTGMLFADYKLQILDRVPDFYFRNAERVKAAAAKAKIELIPAVFSIGYSNGHLAHDPNLAEGLPIVNQPFVVRERIESEPRKGGVAEGGPVPARVRHLEAMLDIRGTSPLRNGNLEQARDHRFDAFSYQDDPGVTTFADRKVVHGGRLSCRMEPGIKGPSRTVPIVRLIQHVKLRPNTPYRFSCWAKTRDLGPVGAFQLLALGASQPGRQLTFHEGGLESNQDWKRVDVAFNSLDQKEANLYVGIWGEGPGTLWVDDLSLEELPLVNVLRRKGCPLTITSADGRTTYDEGRDFEPVIDPQLGNVPWPGEYEFDHAGARVRIKQGSRIKSGDRLLVSWYQPVITLGFQVMCCLSEPKLDQILRDQARRVNELFRPRTFFMSHDEIRVANWCKACRDRKLTPGQLLAENVRQCTSILKSVNPNARIVVWSDMFDPNHNAVDSYYLVNGTLKGSWEGLPRDVIVANWNGGKARESLAFFAGRGHRQLIAGYYDVEDLSNFQNWDSAARDVKGIIGFMYTTWASKYGLLEKYAEAMKAGRKP